MRKFAAIALAVGLAGLVWAASGYAGRRIVTFTSTGAISAAEVGDGVRLAGLSVKYSTPPSLSLYVNAVQSRTTNLVVRIDVSNAASVVYVPGGLWFKRDDLLVLSNSVPVSARAQADFTYE